jgi:hypothetical protein
MKDLLFSIGYDGETEKLGGHYNRKTPPPGGLIQSATRKT